MLHPERPDCFLGYHGGCDWGESFRVRFNLVEEYLVPSCWSGLQAEEHGCLFGLASGDGVEPRQQRQAGRVYCGERVAGGEPLGQPFGSGLCGCFAVASFGRSGRVSANRGDGGGQGAGGCGAFVESWLDTEGDFGGGRAVPRDFHENCVAWFASMSVCLIATDCIVHGPPDACMLRLVGFGNDRDPFGR